MGLRIIAGAFKGRILKAPKGQATRPTQGMLRAAVFNICQNEIENSRFLDLFAGSGAMGLEALSRGAKWATFVEESRLAISCIRENIAFLQVEKKAELLAMDAKRALSLLAKKEMQFDLIYVDPPYDASIDLAPIVPLLAPEGTLFLEERFNPKKSQPLSIPGLQCKTLRKFGTALLSILVRSELL